MADAMRCEIREGAKIKIRKLRVETPAWHDAGGDDGVAGEEQGGGDGDDGGDDGSQANEKQTKPKRSASVLTRFAALEVEVDKAAQSVGTAEVVFTAE
ncbi:uncharacterized protein UDID_17920 [Ustilago sp. UG-2017a]|nr:uncharacterized protein UDID_17920 [Ustilago sp. UG-2017a]